MFNSFGKKPTGERLSRIQQSPNYRDGKFQNRQHTPQIATDKSMIRLLYEFLFQKVKDIKPATPLPFVRTDLKQLPAAAELLIWIGHSSLYIQTNGKKIMVDPVLLSASPVSFMNKPFEATNGYVPADIPDLDYLILTHDHWDHLDYQTVRALKDRIKQVVCPLGVGAHLEHWGFDPARIAELDWHDQLALDGGIRLTALPARHFSGRGLNGNKTLWTAYMLQSRSGNIFICGDTGYDTHFQEIKQQFGTIDFAIMENGQYHEDWAYIHMLPTDLEKAIKELAPKKVMTVHHSKFALGRHAWYEPLDNIARIAAENGFPLITPQMGEVVSLDDPQQTFSPWWKPR